MSARADLRALREALSRERAEAGGPALRFGLPSIDGALPGGGLRAAAHEVCPETADAADEPTAVLLPAVLLARTTGTVLWATTRRGLFSPVLDEVGLSADRVLFAEARRDADVLAVAEEGLRHGGLAGVVAEAPRLSLTASRRLQLAAEAGGVPCLVVRRWLRGRAPSVGTASVTRWSVGVRPSAAPHGSPRAAWRLALTRCRGGVPAGWDVTLEGDEDGASPLRLRLAAELARDAAQPVAGHRAA